MDNAETVSAPKRGQQWFWIIVEDVLFPCEAVNFEEDDNSDDDNILEFYYDFADCAGGQVADPAVTIKCVEPIVGKQAVRAIAKFIAGNLSVNPNEVFDFDAWYEGARLVRGTKEAAE